MDGKAYTVVYENKDGVLEERGDIKITTAAENWWRGTAWADFNNDGNLDILVTGRGISQAVVSYGFKIFLNNGIGQFSEAIDADFPGINQSSVDCADYDGDGDPDISFLGINSAGKAVTGIYENRISDAPKNNIPPAFKISALINVDEDFAPFTIQLTPASSPQWEQSQSVVYTLEHLSEEIVTATINATTGRISFSPIQDAFGSTTFRITANDGQPENNIYSTTIQVNVSAINDAPTLSAFVDLEIELNGNIAEIPFTIQDKDQPLSELVVTATSSNQSLVKDSNILISGSGENRILNINPESGASGETTITVRVTNGVLIVERQFRITITDNITAIEQALSETIKVFPNPILSTLTVESQRQTNKSITIIVSDIRGSEVRRLVTSDKNTVIDLAGANPGVYILRIIDENEISLPLKLIKK